MKKKIALVLVLCLLLSWIPISTIGVHAATEITDPESVSGSDYSDAYAAKLDNIFQGTVSLFSDTDSKFPLGSSLPGTYTVAGTISGSQCYIYAQAVYYYLFGDIPYHGEGIGNYWNHSDTVLTNVSEVSYDQFQNAGVAFGAYVRTTGNRDGSYNGQYGHSLIILTYDKDHIIYLDCNAAGDRVIRVWITSWDEFNENLLTQKGRKISHVVQAEGAELKDPVIAPGGAPTTAELSIDKADLSIGEAFTLTLSSDASCDYYLSIVDADSGEIMVEENVSGTYTNAFSKAGHYIARMTASNAAGSLESNAVDFWVFGALPTVASLTASKKELEQGETVTLSVSTDGDYAKITVALFLYNDNYNGLEVCNGVVPNSFSYTPTEIGIYAGYVTVGTHEGSVESNWVVFYVGSYTVQYDANGGTGAPAAQTKYYGKIITLYTTEPVREGFVFLGWAKKADATVPNYQPGDEFAENANVTLYAVWQQNCADGHNYGSWILEKKPTCTEPGIIYRVCDCGQRETLEVPAAGHRFENGTCTACGEADPNQVTMKGDLDLDGNVDAEDLTLLARHVAGIELLADTTALANADVNGDGSIDANDLTVHARFVAGIITDWEVSALTP